MTVDVHLSDEAAAAQRGFAFARMFEAEAARDTALMVAADQLATAAARRNFVIQGVEIALAALRLGDINAATAELEESLNGWRTVTAVSTESQITARFYAYWNCYTYTGTDVHVPLPDDWEVKVWRLIVTHDLSVAEIEDAVQIAMERKCVKDRFRYFCGVCRRVDK